MIITIAEVIEQCTERGLNFPVENRTPQEVQDMARDRIRALAAQYEGCIVAEDEPVYQGWAGTFYRAREPK